MNLSSIKSKEAEDQVGFHTLKLSSIANNYNKWMFASFCSDSTLEIGRGIGNISKYLVSHF